MSEIADILERAADLIEPEGAWCQGPFAMNRKGSETSPRSRDAVCWCVSGALNRVSRDNGTDAKIFLQRHLGEWPTYFNEKPGRTQGEVVAMLREAAAKARGDQS